MRDLHAPGPHVQVNTTVPFPISLVLSSLTIIRFTGGQLPSAIPPVHDRVIVPGILPGVTLAPQVVKLPEPSPTVTPSAPLVIGHPTSSVTLPEQLSKPNPELVQLVPPPA